MSPGRAGASGCQEHLSPGCWDRSPGHWDLRSAPGWGCFLTTVTKRTGEVNESLA